MKLITTLVMLCGMALSSFAATTWPAATNVPNTFFATNTFRTNVTMVGPVYMIKDSTNYLTWDTWDDSMFLYIKEDSSMYNSRSYMTLNPEEGFAVGSYFGGVGGVYTIDVNGHKFTGTAQFKDTLIATNGVIIGANSLLITNSASGTQFIESGTNAFTITTNSVTVHVPLYGDGYGLTNLSAAAISGVLTQGHSAAVTLSNVVFSGDVYNGLNNGRGYLQAFDHNISKATNATAICLIGDSYVALRHWGPQAAKSIGQFYGYGGIGYCPANTNAASAITGITYTRTGTWTNYGPGSGGVGVNLCHLGGTDTTTGKLTIAGICNQIRIHYVCQTDGGTFAFGVDNGTGYSVDTSSGAGAVPTIAVTNATISSSSVGTHTLRITNTVAGGAGVGIAGFEFNDTTYDSAGNSRFHNLGYSGTKCADWTNVNMVTWSNAINNLNPHLVLVSLGVNEHSGATNLTEYAGALSALVQQIKGAVSNVSVCLVSQSDVTNSVSGPTMGQYIAAMAEVAQSNQCGFINNYQLIPDNLSAQSVGLVSTDGIHINTAGGALYAKNLVSFLRQQEDTTKSLWYVNRPEADSIFLGRPGQGSSMTTGYRNLAFGNYAGNALTTGYDNVMGGYYAGIALTSGQENVLLGSYSGRTLAAGGYNVAIGHKSLYLGSSASAFTALGNQSLYSAAAANGRGVGIGFASGKYETGGTNLYINVWDQVNTAGDKDYSLIYGTFATGAGTRTGAQLTVNGDMKSSGTFTATNGITTPGSLTASNIFLSTPVWRDQIISGLALGAGANAPSVEVVGPTHDGLAIRGLGFAHNEDAHAAAQLNHDIAPTNSYLPSFYVEPHLHLSCTDLSTGTNATFRIVYEWANINGIYTNVAGALTNSVSFTNLYQHAMLEFGHVTNNAAAGSISTIFRFGIERLAGASGDMGNTACVIVDSVDIHYPVWRLGSRTESSD